MDFVKLVSILFHIILPKKSYESERAMFIKMYGADAKFIAPNNMVEVAKTLNNKFLEIAK